MTFLPDVSKPYQPLTSTFRYTKLFGQQNVIITKFKLLMMHLGRLVSIIVPPWRQEQVITIGQKLGAIHRLYSKLM